MIDRSRIWFYAGFVLASLVTYFIGFTILGISIEEGFYSFNVYRSHPLLIAFSCFVGLVGGLGLVSLMEFGIGKRGYIKILTQEEYRSFLNLGSAAPALSIACPYCDSSMHISWELLPDMDLMDRVTRQEFMMSDEKIRCTHCNTDMYISRNSDQVTVMMPHTKRKPKSATNNQATGAKFDLSMGGVLAQILYAAGRSVLYSTNTGLILGGLIIVVFIFYYGHPASDMSFFMMTIASSFGGATIGGLLFGLFIAHDPTIGDLGSLLRPDRRISLPAALIAFLMVFIYQIANQDLQKILEEPSSRMALLAQFQLHREEVFWGLGLSAFIGAIAPPARSFYIFVLSTFTLGDFLRKRHPHHDEESAKTLQGPTHGALHAKAALWYAQRGQAPRARYEWSEAKRLKGLMDTDYQDWASFLAATGDLHGAEAVIREGLEAFGNSIKLRHSLVDIHDKMGLHADQETEFKEMLALDPTYAPALHDYAALLFDQKKYRDALESLNRAITVTPENDSEIVRYLSTRGATYGQLGEFDHAEADFQRAVRLATEFKRKTGKLPPGVANVSRNLGVLHGLRQRK